MINITATAESIEQADKLLLAGIDTIYVGNQEYGLRLPTSFNDTNLKKLTELVHNYGKKITIAVNGIMHPEKMQSIVEYLYFLEKIQIDQIVVGDPGVIYVIQQNNIKLPYIYDAQTMVTSARQINFWAKRGAIGAVLAREVPFKELKKMQEELTVFGEILVYGATCIHQSLRPLLRNYFAYTENNEQVSKERGLFLSEPTDDNSHYSIYEDSHGTHIFAQDDLNLMTKLNELYQIGFYNWKLDGLYTDNESFVKICECFVKAKQNIEEDNYDTSLIENLEKQVKSLHPANRTLGTGFYDLNPEDIR